MNEVTLDVLTFSCVPRTVFKKAFKGFKVVYGSSKNGEILCQIFMSLPGANGEAVNPGCNGG